MDEARNDLTKLKCPGIVWKIVREEKFKCVYIYVQAVPKSSGATTPVLKPYQPSL